MNVCPKLLFRTVLLTSALGVLSGCDTVGGAVSSAGSSVGGFFSHRDPAADGLNRGSNTDPRLTTAVPAQRPSDRLKVLPVAAQDINCPDVTVAEGGAALRVGGADNASVRYQFSLGDTARQCDPAGTGQATIKVGVAGQVVIGPAGSAGTFSAPLKITITKVGGDKPVFSQTYRAEATTDGVRAGQFRIVTDPIPLPMPSLQLADLYTVTVGFEGGTNAQSPTGRRPRRTRTSG